MRIKAYRSPDKRLRTESFRSKRGDVFCVAEPTAWGSLVSMFKKSGEIVDRAENERTKNAASALDMYLTGIATLEIIETETFEHVRAQAACTKCGGREIERELDSQDTSNMREFKVVPVFVCNGCGSRFCMVGEEYVRGLISKYSRYIAMGKGQSVENSAFIGSVRDNIIRSFASQNIRELEIRATA
ncbi:MAG: hypothetical protein KGH57_02080 [Candidatus Micrarchaeota archaeon]|nr:hypothetical protein [Candidatus Micrarchaeota archaeon]